MSPNDAAKILEIPVDSTPEQLEAHFLELRRKLEDKIAKAPTPGLQAKYRSTLQEITAAFETLTLAADSTTLPVLQRQDSAVPSGVAPSAATTRAPTPTAAPAAATPAPRRPAKRKSSPLEFIMVAVIAVAVLGAGGWWIIQQREQKAEQARLTAVAEAAALVKKQEEVATADRLAQLATDLRTKLAEYQVTWDAYESEMRDAERRASDARSELRGFRDGPASKKAELSALATGHELFTNWLKAYLLRHPAKVARARAAQLLEAKSVEAARLAVEELAAALATVDEAIKDRQSYYLQGRAEVILESKPAGLAYVFTDAYGRTQNGTTPGLITGVPLTHVVDPTPNASAQIKLGEYTTGTNSARFLRPGWDDIIAGKPSPETGTISLQAEFTEGALRVESLPTGIPWRAVNDRGWTVNGDATPATVSPAPPGRVTVRLIRTGFKDVEKSTDVAAGATATVSLEQASQEVDIKVAEAGSVIFVDGKFAGRTEVTLKGLIPGEHALQLELKGYSPYRTKFTVKQELSRFILKYSFTELAVENITCTNCRGAGRFAHERRCIACNGTMRARCDYCEGRGTLGGRNGFPVITCHVCNGNGRVRCQEYGCANGIYRWTEGCTTCGGDGRRSALQLSP